MANKPASTPLVETDDLAALVDHADAITTLLHDVIDRLAGIESKLAELAQGGGDR
jgi:hypothetical protein